MTRARILVVDDKPNFLALFKRIVPADIEVVCAGDGALALELLAAEPFDVVVSDIRMPGADGMTLLRQVRDRGIVVEVILMTAFGTIPDAVKAMKDGAADYLTKPFVPDDAISAIEHALERRKNARAALEEGSGMASATSLPYREAIAVGRDRATREYLVALLKDVQGNVTQAAERAGIERESFHRLMKRHSVRAEDYRAK